MDEKAELGLGRGEKETEKALLVILEETGDEVWVPKSQIHDDSEVFKEGQSGEVVVSAWWAEKKGLV
jgi:hypothetical protein